jgi:hypothetical protein
MCAYELAQLNIGIIRGPMDSPVMAQTWNESMLWASALRDLCGARPKMATPRRFAHSRTKTCCSTCPCGETSSHSTVRLQFSSRGTHAPPPGMV